MHEQVTTEEIKLVAVSEPEAVAIRGPLEGSNTLQMWQSSLINDASSAWHHFFLQLHWALTSETSPILCPWTTHMVPTEPKLNIYTKSDFIYTFF